MQKGQHLQKLYLLVEAGALPAKVELQVGNKKQIPDKGATSGQEECWLLPSYLFRNYSILNSIRIPLFLQRQQQQRQRLQQRGR